MIIGARRIYKDKHASNAEKLEAIKLELRIREMINSSPKQVEAKETIKDVLS